jgi:hypothetical protein
MKNAGVRSSLGKRNGESVLSSDFRDPQGLLHRVGEISLQPAGHCLLVGQNLLASCSPPLSVIPSSGEIRAIHALETIIACCKVDGVVRRVFQRELNAWRSSLDATQTRKYRALRVHTACRPGRFPVTTLLRLRPTGDYDIAQRERGSTRIIHSGYRDRVVAEQRFEQLTGAERGMP